MKVNILTNAVTEKATIGARKYLSVLALLLLIGGLPLSNALADNTASQPLDEIRSTAESFVLSNLDTSGLHDVSVSTANLDARLTLKECEMPLEAFSTSNNRNMTRATVGIRCNGSKPWTLYVPVTINAMVDAIYTARPLLRGETLTPSAVEVRQVPLNQLPANSLSDMSALSDLETIRPLRAGTPLSLNSLRTRQMIEQGQQVVILGNGNGIQVKMEGTAMKSGSYGEFIPVKNSRSGRVVEAAIRDEGTVIVSL